ncbi:hypothetical protein JG688_00014111 [Phytophthora aleatoria]|uniref:Uncharacterized protein n=1 Tax=Phytophthora aleatoria TaxID=2496075 RepID=A0A8J5ICD6_9STRA|nr:hypothetical protein JG688_00014111 [Phytophthora aleatoria]
MNQREVARSQAPPLAGPLRIGLKLKRTSSRIQATRKRYRTLRDPAFGTGPATFMHDKRRNCDVLTGGGWGCPQIGFQLRGR